MYNETERLLKVSLNRLGIQCVLKLVVANVDYLDEHLTTFYEVVLGNN